MALFDFVSGEEFRQLLEADYAEIDRCREIEAWKAVHVLAGSIAEALLVDYLAGSDIPARLGVDPLTLDLGGAIKLCRQEKVISERAASLSDTVRTYRNLIHPGRLLRLAETVDREGADVAVALVDMLARELGKARAETRGFTAEQVVTKIERDPSAIAITTHLIKELKPDEHERLVLKVVPERYLGVYQQEEDASIPRRIATLYRAAYDAAPVTVQKKATEQFSRVVRDEQEEVVLAYETAFFRAPDLVHLPKAQADMVKAHILARFKAKRSPELTLALKGIGKFLNVKEQQTLIDACVNEIVYGTSAALDTEARGLLDDLYTVETVAADAKLVERLGQWVSFLKTKDRPADAETIEGLKTQYEAQDELPF